MRMAIGADHGGFELKEALKKVMNKQGIIVEDVGCDSLEAVDYPDYARMVAEMVSEGLVAQGVLICRTGIGMSMAANKVHGIRAALCQSEFEARSTRAHNDANVLCLGERVIGAGVAMGVLAAFLDGRFEGGRHQRRVDKLDELHGRDRGAGQP